MTLRTSEYIYPPELIKDLLELLERVRQDVMSKTEADTITAAMTAVKILKMLLDKTEEGLREEYGIETPESNGKDSMQ